MRKAYGLFCGALLIAAVGRVAAQSPVPAQAWSQGGAAAADESAAGLYAAGGFYYLKPHWSSSNPAYTLTTNALTRPTPSTADFEYDFEFAPRVYVGYRPACGWGVRADYWRLEDRSSTSLTNYDSSGNTVIRSVAPLAITAPPGRNSSFLGNGVTGNENNFVGGPGITSPGWLFSDPFPIGADTLRFESSLTMDVVDAEATWSSAPDGWQVVVTGGGRYARLSQTYDAFRFNRGTLNGFAFTVTGIDTAELRSSREFNGGGPTCSVELRVTLGGNFALYGNGRGTLLVGEDDQRASIASSVTGNTRIFGTTPFDSSTSAQARAAKTELIPVAELEAGAEWAAAVGGLRLFSRTGVVVQSWFGAGNASDEHGDLVLYGFTVTAGVRY